MAVIAEHARIAERIFRMRLKGAAMGRAGQFYMLRQPDTLDPFLSRPVSLFDADENTGEVSFLYQVSGRGTELFSRMPAGQELAAQGPCGNGFPILPGDAVLIGGGIGTAPLYLLLKELRKADPLRRIEVYLGFREEAYLEAEFAALSDKVKVNLGGYVTADVDFNRNAAYYACGPAPMLRAAAQAAREAGATLYVSLEKHMACGVGACLGCTCKTASGQKRICKDGPVFPYREVYDAI
ncbi:MAG TPA: dihydroorotate dehydrogenase electron transfer subunit [Feifaniaceae bacterium]|nr:dihydroorotate dehydrogenase electron transfer subunit [Feifaniaceae bacterium]